MSRWQDAYAQGLRKRAADLRAVGDSLASKIEWKAEVDEARLDNQVAKEAKPFCSPKDLKWRSEAWRADLDQTQERLERAGGLVPLSQAEEWRESLERLGQNPDLDWETFVELRQDLLTRLRRSAWALTHGEELKPLTPIRSQGHYNNRNTLEDFVALAAQGDPIWTADFGQLYQRLYQLAETLAPTTRRNA